MPAVYLLHCRGEDFRASPLFRSVFALWVLYFVILTIAQITTFFYYYTPDNQIAYGAWYALSVAPLMLILVLLQIGVIRRRGKLSKRHFYAFLAFLIPLSITLLVQMIVPTFGLIALGLTLSALSMFGIIVTEQISQYLRLQQENAVKHGMGPHTVPLHVSIRTSKTHVGSQIVVEDNGIGFDPALAERPNTTLANIRQRLEMMCGGTLEISSLKGGGTTVKVTIPAL